MSFTFFNIGSILIVLGFTFKVIQVTSRLTEMKSKKAGTKFRNIGGMSIFAGLLIFLLALFMTANERNSMILAGANIIAIGISTLIQYFLTPKNEKALSGVAYGTITLGFILCLLYEIVTIVQAPK